MPHQTAAENIAHLTSAFEKLTNIPFAEHGHASTKMSKTTFLICSTRETAQCQIIGKKRFSRLVSA